MSATANTNLLACAQVLVLRFGMSLHKFNVTFVKIRMYLITCSMTVFDLLRSHFWRRDGQAGHHCCRMNKKTSSAGWPDILRLSSSIFTFRHSRIRREYALIFQSHTSSIASVHVCTCFDVAPRMVSTLTHCVSGIGLSIEVFRQL